MVTYLTVYVYTLEIKSEIFRISFDCIFSRVTSTSFHEINIIFIFYKNHSCNKGLTCVRTVIFLAKFSSSSQKKKK